MLQLAVDRLVYGILGLDPAARWTGALHFFIYDTVKILVLLYVMILAIGFLRTFLPQDKVKYWLGKKGLAGHGAASLFGALTPFCSCSSIPIFLGFLEAGVPLGVTFSFLITSPLINEYLVVLMLGFFGWKITVIYVLSGILIGILAGWVLGRMRLDRHLVRDLVTRQARSVEEDKNRGFRRRLAFGLGEASSIVRKVWVWVLVGVGVGSLIHNYVPQEAVQGIIDRTGVMSVPVATALGVPMYGSCAAIVPVAVVLFNKGIPLGTALAFMMATAALSLPEAVMLRRAMRLKLIVLFFGVTTAGIVFTGYLFNWCQILLT